jgi:hypothetical protein
VAVSVVKEQQVEEERYSNSSIGCPIGSAVFGLDESLDLNATSFGRFRSLREIVETQHRKEDGGMMILSMISLIDSNLFLKTTKLLI